MASPVSAWNRTLAVHRVHEQAAGGENLVPDHLGVHPESRSSSQHPIFRISGELFGGGNRCLAVGPGGHDLLDQGLDVPSRIEERHREMVEQFRVTGNLALGSEIL